MNYKPNPRSTTLLLNESRKVAPFQIGHKKRRIWRDISGPEQEGKVPLPPLHLFKTFLKQRGVWKRADKGEKV